MAQTVAPRPRTPAPDPNALPLIPPPRRRRRWSLALVGALVTVGSALAFAVLWMNAGDRVAVLALRNRVAVGQVVEEGDLRVVRVSADPGLATIPADRIDDVVGLFAATDLVPGTLLNAEHVREDELVERGTAVVGLALRQGQLPDGITRGDRVQVVRTVPPGSESESLSLGVVLAEGRVVGIRAGELNSGTDIVSLSVDEDIAAEVAGAASAELVSLVLIPQS